MEIKCAKVAIHDEHFLLQYLGKSSKPFFPNGPPFLYLLTSNSLIRIIIGFIIKVVNIRYWHTRSSTVGISKFATILFAVVTLGNYFLANLYSLKEHLLITLFATIAHLPLELAPFLMLKTICRMEFGWNQNKGKGKWTEKGKKRERKCEVPFPNVNFGKATHAERASDRLDARTPWTMKLSVSILLLCSPRIRIISSCVSY